MPLIRFKESPVFLMISLAVAGLYFSFWWLFRLDILPGLHGDEAWFGIQAVKYNEEGISSFHGMNNYTGILQSLMASTVFKIWGAGVTQLRFGGVMANGIALVVLGIVFIRNGAHKAFVVFLLIMAQSGLYLISPRVAWEVNSFTLIFIALNALAVTELTNDRGHKSIPWFILFLITNIAGTYNHIIFSGLSIALLLGILLWSFYAGSDRYRLLILLSLFNAFNVCSLFLLSKYNLLNYPASYIFLCVMLLIAAECFAVQFLNRTLAFKFLPVSSPAVYIILAASVIYFSVYHGLAFAETYSNYKLIMHAYSLELPAITKISLSVLGIAVLMIFAWLLVSDLKTSRKPSFVFEFVLIIYLGILPFYTTNNSFRYYLIAYALTAVYISLRVSQNKMIIKVFIPLMIMSCVAINVMLGYVFTNPGRPVRALEISVGKKQVETSAHFLPNQPLIRFLREHKAGNFYYLSNSYFLGQVIEFYKLSNPWEALPENQVVIDYDYSPNDHGGYLLFRK